MQETKGYCSLKGKIWGLNNKEPKDINAAKRNISFGLQLSADNSIFVQLGDWKNTKLNVKLRGEGMTEITEINEQEAVDRIKEFFKDGDSVYINARPSINTFRKSIDILANQIYIEKEPLDFKAEDFEATNFLNQTVIVTEKPSNRKAKVGLTTYQGEMIEQEVRLSDDIVNDYFVENVKVGDVLRLTIGVNRIANYVEGESSSPTKERTTLKGRHVGGGNTNTRKVLDKNNPYTEFLEIVDVDVEQTEKQKYTRDDIREALEKAENRDYSKKVITETNNTKIEEEDLPY